MLLFEFQKGGGGSTPETPPGCATGSREELSRVRIPFFTLQLHFSGAIQRLIPEVLFDKYQYHFGGGGGGTTRPLPRDGGAEKLRVDPTVRPHPKVWTIGQE